jgi:hypothetical protein
LTTSAASYVFFHSWKHAHELTSTQGNTSAPLTGSVGDATIPNKNESCKLNVKFPPSPVAGPYNVVDVRLRPPILFPLTLVLTLSTTRAQTDYKTYSVVVSCLGTIGHALGLDDVWYAHSPPLSPSPRHRPLHCAHSHAHRILSRQPVLDPATLSALIAKLQSYGFELNDLATIQQQGCPPV